MRLSGSFEQIGRSVSEYKRQVEEMPAGFDSEAYPEPLAAVISKQLMTKN